MLTRPTKGSRRTPTLFAAQQLADAANFQAGLSRNQTVRYNEQINTPFHMITVKNVSGSDLPKYSAVRLENPTILPANNATYVDVNTTPYDGTMSGGSYPYTAILLEPLSSTKIGHAMMHGQVLAKINHATNLEWCMRAGFSGVDLMDCSPKGEASIIWKEPSGSPRWAWLQLESPKPIQQIGVAAADMEPSAVSSYAMECYSDPSTATEHTEQVYLDWMHGDQKISTGKQVLACWFPWENKWRIIGAECEDRDPPYPYASWAGEYA